MIRFICNKCNDTLELIKATIKNIDGKWRTEQAYCKKCDEWMQELEKDSWKVVKCAICHCLISISFCKCLDRIHVSHER